MTGTWEIRSHMLRERLRGCDEWDVFPGRSEAKIVLGGMGQLDTVVFDGPDGVFHGMTLRLFNPATEAWSLHWADGERGMLFPPLTGRFSGGVGRFLGLDYHAGKSVPCRFIWSHITSVTARWEQAFSGDAGETWETNWIMEFSKVSELAEPVIISR
jgi:hypothetical protein